jgi:hypothetical protein
MRIVADNPLINHLKVLFVSGHGHQRDDFQLSTALGAMDQVRCSLPLPLPAA